MQVYHQTQVKKTISRFTDTALASKIHEDGKLLVAGDASGLVQIFDLNSRAILRSLKGHSNAVRTVSFAGKNILSGSDDNTVKLWDITTEEVN